MSFTVTPRQFAAAIGGLLLIAGIVFLLLPVTATAEAGLFGDAAEIQCGSAFMDNTSALGGEPLAQCQDTIGSRRVWAWPLTLAGLVIVAGALLVKSPTRDVDQEPVDTD